MQIHIFENAIIKAESQQKLVLSIKYYKKRFLYYVNFQLNFQLCSSVQINF